MCFTTVLGMLSLTLSLDYCKVFQKNHLKKIPQIKRCTYNNKYLLIILNKTFSAYISEWFFKKSIFFIAVTLILRHKIIVNISGILRKHCCAFSLKTVHFLCVKASSLMFQWVLNVTLVFSEIVAKYIGRCVWSNPFLGKDI